MAYWFFVLSNSKTAMALKTQNPVFAHPSESEFAQILDFYGVECEYEPRSFPEELDGDRLVELQPRISDQTMTSHRCDRLLFVQG